jgi:hypothetical protein
MVPTSRLSLLLGDFRIDQKEMTAEEQAQLMFNIVEELKGRFSHFGFSDVSTGLNNNIGTFGLITDESHIVWPDGFNWNTRCSMVGYTEPAHFGENANTYEVRRLFLTKEGEFMMFVGLYKKSLSKEGRLECLHGTFRRMDESSLKQLIFARPRLLYDFFSVLIHSLDYAIPRKASLLEQLETDRARVRSIWVKIKLI